LIKTIDYNLIWDDFKDFYVLIESSNELKTYTINTYPDLAYFVDSWAKFWIFKFILFIEPKHTFQCAKG